MFAELSQQVISKRKFLRYVHLNTYVDILERIPHLYARKTWIMIVTTGTLLTFTKSYCCRQRCNHTGYKFISKVKAWWFDALLSQYATHKIWIHEPHDTSVLKFPVLGPLRRPTRSGIQTNVTTMSPSKGVLRINASNKFDVRPNMFVQTFFHILMRWAQNQMVPFKTATVDVLCVYA